MELHRNVSLLAAALLALHLASAVADSFVDISPADAVLPFRSPFFSIVEGEPEIEPLGRSEHFSRSGLDRRW